MGQRFKITADNKGYFDKFCAAEHEAGRAVTVEVLASTKDDELNRRINGYYRNLVAQVPGHTFNDVRAITKLHIGVPLLREKSEAYREKYDSLIKDRFTHEEKQQLMVEPMEFPVTSAMNSEQKKEYCKRLRDFWAQRGFLLTEIED